MNTFVLSYDPKEAASFHCNKHVVKMILESAQMLCAAHWTHLLKKEGKSISDFKRIKDAQAWAYEHTPAALQPIWKMSHMRHPCTVWTGENISNYAWQLSLCESLIEEYTKRYGRIHKSTTVATWLRQNFPIEIEEKSLSNFPVCMREEYKVYNEQGIIDVVESYRNYYLRDKVRFAKWEPRSNTPVWFKEGIKNG